MGYCSKCLFRARKNKDYLSDEDKNVVATEECQVHPSLDNWRFWRMLKSIQYWASQPIGFQDLRCPTPITLGEGWVHRRNAEVILFDYERYFIDLAIERGVLEQAKRDSVARAVRLTDAGNVALFDYIKTVKPDV